MRASSPRDPTRPLGWLLAAGGLALLLRLLGAEEVFRGADVIFREPDSYYHLRRALYSLVNFPAVLERDPYLDFPAGAAVPWPPLWDFLLAALARACGGGERTLEWVAALAPPVVGALCVVPAYWTGRLLADRATGVLAAFLVALLEAHARTSRVGYADHHALTALLAAWLVLATLLVLARAGDAGRVWRNLLLVAARAGVVLTWPGSVILLAVTEGGLLLGSVLEPDRERRRRLHVEGFVGRGLTSALLLPFAVAAGASAEYGVSPSHFSHFHPLGFGVLAALDLAALAFDRARPAAGPGFRLGALTATGLGLAGALLFGSASLRGGVEYGFRFLSGTHAAGDRVLEERPLFGRGGVAYPQSLFGFALYLLPLSPLGLVGALRDPLRRAAAAVFLAWLAFFALLSLTALRFTNELAVAAAVALAALLVGAGRTIARRLAGGPTTLATGLGLVLVAVLLLPTLRVHAERARSSLRVLRGGAPLESFESQVYRFARQVRAATPETRGFLDAREIPEYGIFTWSSLGHILHYVARRATPADNFGPTLRNGVRSFVLSTELFRMRDPERALAELARLRTPYVVSTGFDWGPDDAFGNRLHQDDGSGRAGRPALDRVRLLLESAPGFDGGIPYKLFEVVEGAAVEIPAQPGSAVEATLRLRTNDGRTLEWRHRVVADAGGRARLRIPYATTSTLAPTRALGPVEIASGAGALRFDTTESQVREGSRVEPAPSQTSFD